MHQGRTNESSPAALRQGREKSPGSELRIRILTENECPIRQSANGFPGEQQFLCAAKVYCRHLRERRARLAYGRLGAFTMATFFEGALVAPAPLPRAHDHTRSERKHHNAGGGEQQAVAPNHFFEAVNVARTTREHRLVVQVPLNLQA